MNELGFGACLADDMGLGKTLQVLTLLEKLRKEGGQKRVLLVVPASLLGNWKREAEKFVSEMPVHILHGGGAAALAEELETIESFLFITTYGMTGTPIENDLTNLWSIYDFIDKGLLGGFAEFKEYTKKLAKEPEEYARLESAISPFMLRRLKTDKRVITDLPEKVETVDYVSLSKKQVVLYRKLVAELEEKCGGGFVRGWSEV